MVFFSISIQPAPREALALKMPKVVPPTRRKCNLDPQKSTLAARTEGPNWQKREKLLRDLREEGDKKSDN